MERTLQLCISTWNGVSKSLSANILNAVAKIVGTYENDLDDSQFKERNQSLAMKDLARTAKELHGGSIGYAEALVRNYNIRCRNPLDTMKLYSRKKKT